MKFSAAFYIIIGFITGAAILCLLSIFQYVLMGSDFLILKNYMVPSSFGALVGVIISYLWYRSKKILVEKLDIEEKAITDELTGLYNRRGFFALANHQIKLANRNKNNVLLLYIDINDLKKINDSMGHQKGDRALAEAADILKNTFRKSDIIARMGGDELVVFAIDASEDSYEKLTNHLRSNLDSFNKTKKYRFILSLSYGKAIYEYRHPETIDKLLSVADADMYTKKGKKNTRLD